MKTLVLNETDSPVILPCDNRTAINTSDTVTGNYSYCKNEMLLVAQSSSYHHLIFNSNFDKTTICCFDHDQNACAICYNLVVYCKC